MSLINITDHAFVVAVSIVVHVVDSHHELLQLLFFILFIYYMLCFLMQLLYGVIVVHIIDVVESDYCASLAILLLMLILT
jgi:hypothetical protein